MVTEIVLQGCPFQPIHYAAVSNNNNNNNINNNNNNNNNNNKTIIPSYLCTVYDHAAGSAKERHCGGGGCGCDVNGPGCSHSVLRLRLYVIGVRMIKRGGRG